MKPVLFLLFSMLLSSCVPVDSKLADLTRAQKVCVNECYQLEACAGERPDPCADFCLEDDGPETMTEWLAECELWSPDGGS